MNFFNNNTEVTLVAPYLYVVGNYNMYIYTCVCVYTRVKYSGRGVKCLLP